MTDLDKPDHGETVARVGAMIAEELGWGADRIAQVRLAGFLHDVGKVVVPENVLLKPGRLTDAEYAVVKSHSVIGERILRWLEIPHIPSWVRSHHERIDGGGYPDGLKGDEIPAESRLLLVADAYDALVSDRAYRNARSPEKAYDEIAGNAATQFDTNYVAALGRVLDNLRRWYVKAPRG